MTPDELARELGISPKSLRSWLRDNSARSPAEKHQRWELDAVTADAAKEHFASTGRAGGRAMGSDHSVRPSKRAMTSLDDRRTAFEAATIHTRAQVLAVPSPVPIAPGAYGWWFRHLPTELDTAGCLKRSEFTLLYTGISPKRPPTNGRPPSRQTLHDRIKYHYTGNAEGSTLRKTLGALLADVLGLELRRVGSGGRMTFGAGERSLSAWMADNALVSWVVDPEPWDLEDYLIANLDVPLNLDGNAHNRFHPQLTAVRKQAVSNARELPVVPNPRIGGR